MSMVNNIAEGSGSSSNREFSRFFKIAKKSTFEHANMIIIINRRELVNEDKRNKILERSDHLCRKIISFKRTLKL
jgi:four helix bundle protein